MIGLESEILATLETLHLVTTSLKNIAAEDGMLIVGIELISQIDLLKKLMEILGMLSLISIHSQDINANMTQNFINGIQELQLMIQDTFISNVMITNYPIMPH